MSTPHFHLLRIKEVRPETAECVSVSFDIPELLQETFQFLPGQYLTLRKTIDGKEVRRSDSICSAPGDELRVAVKKVDQGKFSGYVNTGLKAGDELEVMPPLGKFTPRTSEKTSKKYLAFAAGSGITPLVSMTRALAVQGMPVPLILVYWARTRHELCFVDGLKRLAAQHANFVVHFVLTREAVADDEPAGRISEESIRSLVGDVASRQVYACGPGGFVDSARSLLAPAAESFHAEAFSPPPRFVEDSGSVQVTLAASGRTLTLPRGEWLLKALEAE